MCLCLKKTFVFQKQYLLNMSGYCCFPGFVILPVRMHPTCLSFVLFGHDFPTKASQVSPSGLSQVLFLTLECIVKAKKKIDPSHESVQSLYFSTWPKLEAIFSQIKSSSHEINLLDDSKYDK